MRFGTWCCAFVFCSIGFAVPVHAQDARAARMALIKQGGAAGKSTLDQIPSAVQNTLPAHGRLAHLADMIDNSSASAAQSPGAAGDARDADDDDDSGLARVNDPRSDFAFSPFAGYTQSTTSTARCGDSVVVGFNDSRSTLATVFRGNGGVSLSGVAVSNDGGKSFRDLGAVPPGLSPTNFLLGQPSVACSDSRHFFYAQDFTDTANSGFVTTAVALSRSSDGGQTWSDPVPVTKPLQNLGGELFDDGRAAVDPSNPSRVYV